MTNWTLAAEFLNRLKKIHIFPTAKASSQKYLVRLFITAKDMMLSDTHKVVIHDDGTQAGEHVRRFNVPIKADVAIIIVSDQF